jgi:hypothetical protein
MYIFYIQKKGIQRGSMGSRLMSNGQKKTNKKKIIILRLAYDLIYDEWWEKVSKDDLQHRPSSR